MPISIYPPRSTTVANISADAFARLRISNPVTVFDMQKQYGSASMLFEDINAGTGATTHLPNESSVQLSTGGTASGAKCVRQTRQYFRYHPGKAQLILLSRTIGAAKANVRQRVGYFDAQNGLFFEQTIVGISVTSRSYTSGGVVDTNVLQSSWNVDKLDGTGASGITLNTTNMNLYFINFQWLGTGNASLGIFYDGTPVICHTFQNSNVLTVPYMTTPNLPIRNEIENTGVAATLTTMKATCNSVISEGGNEEGFGYDFTIGNGITTKAATTRRAIISIRPAATFNGIVTRGEIDLQAIDLIASSNSCYWEMVYNPTYTVGGGALTWTSVDSNSMVEYCIHSDANAGAFTNGIVTDAGFVVAGGSGVNAFSSSAGTGISSRWPVVLDSTGANPRGFALVCTSFTGTTNVSGAIEWSEEY